jgi:hypothetical protein
MDNFDLKKFLTKGKLLTEGQFSWITQDTEQQIGSEPENTLPFVYMHDNKGNKWLEKNYEGYGVFGDKDYYELLDQMNGGSGDRSEGIKLAFDDAATTAGKVFFPALTVSATISQNHDFTEEATNDPNQSWYQEEEEDDYNLEDYDDFEDDDRYLNESFNINEGVWSVGNPDDIKLFIKKIEELKDDFYSVVGSDDVFDGLGAAQRGAEELLQMAIRNKA